MALRLRGRSGEGGQYCFFRARRAARCCCRLTARELEQTIQQSVAPRFVEMNFRGVSSGYAVGSAISRLIAIKIPPFERDFLLFSPCVNENGIDTAFVF